MKIRRITQDDLTERVRWMNNAAVYSTMHFKPPITLENTIGWYKRNQQNPLRCDVVFEDDHGTLLAMGGLTAIDQEVQKAELYIFVNPDMQRRGIGTEATRLLCRYGFEELRLHKIYLFTNANNIGARRAYEKVGFRLEGVQRKEVLTSDGFDDRVYYGLLSEESGQRNESCGECVSKSIILERHNVFGKEIAFVRDDLFAQSGGGIKSRKSIYYELYMRQQHFNACVTTGGIQSNHNRAIALMCAKNGWRCHIVFHGTRERFEAEKGNALLVRKSGVTYEFVEAEQIGVAMDSAMKRLVDQGYSPMYIHGGGHDLPGGIALVEAVKMLKEKCDVLGYKPDYIFHASGTGSTQAGIAVGLDLVGWKDVRLIGMSVARRKERGTQVIEEFASMLAQYYGLKKDYQGTIEFNTDYLCGGYEKYTPEMAGFLDGIMKSTGLMFDSTYSGKAFYGMCNYLEKNNINANVLFWHTGGLMNMMK